LSDPYAPLVQALAAAGLASYQRNPDMLVVSTESGLAWPSPGNSFWLSHQRKAWHLVTWLPCCYRVAPEADVVALCGACMAACASAMYRVPGDIAVRFGLEELSEAEFEKVFPG
jgi:hypothetical protein